MLLLVEAGIETKASVLADNGDEDSVVTSRLLLLVLNRRLAATYPELSIQQ